MAGRRGVGAGRSPLGERTQRAGQLGDGTTMDRSTPGQVSGLTNAVEIDAGDQHTCALRQTGVLSCWGNNLNGQLGNGNSGSMANRLVPTDVVWP